MTQVKKMGRIITVDLCLFVVMISDVSWNKL